MSPISGALHFPRILPFVHEHNGWSAVYLDGESMSVRDQLPTPAPQFHDTCRQPLPRSVVMPAETCIAFVKSVPVGKQPIATGEWLRLCTSTVGL